MTKHFFSTLLLAVGLCFGANAQDEVPQSPNRWGFGIRIGFGTTYIDGDEAYDDTESIFNLNVGASVNYDLTPNFNLESGLYYTKKGYYYELLDTETTCNIYYLQIPLLAGYKFDAGKNANFVLQAGPYGAFATNGKTKVKTHSLSEDKKKEATEKSHSTFDDLKRLDVGLKVALGCTLYKDFYLGASYEHGLTNIAESEADAFSKTLYFSIGFNF